MKPVNRDAADCLAQLDEAQSGQRQAERALRALDHRLHELIDSAPVVMIVLSPDHKITEFNREAERIYGRRRSEVLGWDYFEMFLPVEAWGPVARDMQKVMAGRPTKDFENVVKAASGRELTLSWSVNRIVDGAGKTTGVVAVGLDISALKSQKLLEREITDRKHRHHLSQALNNISVALSASREFDKVLPRAVSRAAQAVAAESVVVFLFEEGRWRIGHCYGRPIERVPERFLGRLTPELRPMIVKDARKDPRIDREFVTQYDLRSFVTIPLTAKGELLGALSFNRHSAPIPFARGELDFAKKFSVLLSLAFKNVYDYVTTEQALGDSRLLGRIAARVTESLELKEVLNSALDGALETLNIRQGCIYVEEGGRFVIRSQRRLSHQFLEIKSAIGPGEGCAGEAAVTQKPFAPTQEARHFVCAESQKLLGLDCMAAVPIVLRGETLGILELFAPVARRLSTRERRMVQTISNQLAVSLQNARLFAAEHDISATLQKALLTTPTDIDGVMFGHLYRSATAEAAEVGGDFYDVFEIEHGNVGILIGDVSGKGLRAATLTSLIRNTIRAYAYQNDQPSEVVAKTNKLILKTPPEGAFVTLFFGLLETASGRLTYCDAGHPPPLIKRVGGDTFALSVDSPALGIFPELAYEDRTERLERGDILLLYTDGLIEARRDHDFFGEQRAIDFVRNSMAETRQLPEAIYSEVIRFTGGRLNDDVALLAVSHRH
jgi:PAS domain S-box-containing protein